jgi:hypothetical protein
VAARGGEAEDEQRAHRADRLTLASPLQHSTIMTSRWASVFLAITAIAACKSDKAPPPQAGSAAGSAAPVAPSAAAGEAPAATPPADLAAAFTGEIPTGFSTLGADLELPSGASAEPGSNAKVDPGTLATPKTDDIPEKTFGGVSTMRGFRVSYLASKDELHERLRGALEKGHVFEALAENLNEDIRLPRSVRVNLADCGTVNAFYDPTRKQIYMCYELMSYFAGIFANAAKKSTKPVSDGHVALAMMGATQFVFFHEVGHGLIDILKLPAVGREEDSVDQLAALILIGAGEEGVGMAMAGAYWFKLSHDAGNDRMPFSDEHAFDGQRYYNILCLVYGSNPTKYAQIASSGALPRDRAVRCPSEFKKISKAWETLLQPHLANKAAVRNGYTPAVDPAETEIDESLDANPAAFGGDDDPAPTNGGSIPDSEMPVVGSGSATGSGSTAGSSSTKLGNPPRKFEIEGCEKLKKTVGKPQRCAALALEINKLDCNAAGSFDEARRLGDACFKVLKDRLEELRVAARPNSCEKVSAHARRLMLTELVAEAKGDSGGSAGLRKRIESELPAFQEALLATCAQKPWSEADRDCVLKAKTLADARSSCKM